MVIRVTFFQTELTVEICSDSLVRAMGKVLLIKFSIVVIWVKIFKTEKTIEIHLVRLTEVCGKVLSEKYA